MHISRNTAAFLAVHLSLFLLPFVEFRWSYVAVAAALYVLRMFAITAGYHRYLAHRAFKTSRPFQFFLALFGTTAAQKGPLWWASVHRTHHRKTDRAGDIHSPSLQGFWHAHVGWILGRDHDEPDRSNIEDLARYPELRWLDRYHVLPPTVLGLAVFFIGGFGALLWCFCLSTVLLWHATFAINSLAHTWGTRRYPTSDTSRNNLLLAIFTLGEGWHNNHHRYCSSARQGFFWWEIDASYYALRVLSMLRIVRRLRPVPQQLLTVSDSPPVPIGAQSDSV